MICVCVSVLPFLTRHVINRGLQGVQIDPMYKCTLYIYVQWIYKDLHYMYQSTFFGVRLTAERMLIKT